ncbi:MAG: DUF2169 domain-containing protein [Byssovorax sp.]
MGKGEQHQTLGLDPKLAERLAQPLPFAGIADEGQSLKARLLEPPEGASPAPIALDAMLFREGASLKIAVIVKAAFSLVDPVMVPAEAPEPFRPLDVHYLNRPLGHVIAASDRVPRKDLVDVTLVGPARAPNGEAVPEMRARLVVLQGSRAIDKAVQVLGNRADKDAAPAPFVSMPITWERAYGGATPVNPIGCSGYDDDQPNIVDPQNPFRPVGFGPISAAWPLRNKRLGALTRAFLDAPIVDIPEGFDWGYFQSAPTDQQLAELDPEAIVVLEGFHEGKPRLEISLPNAQAKGAIYGLDPAAPDAPRELAFRADTLHLDTDRWLATITFRASIDLRGTEDLGRLLVAVGVCTGDRAPAIPAERPEPTRLSLPNVPIATRPGAPASTSTGTLELRGAEEAPPMTLPFSKGDGPDSGQARDTLLLPPEPGVLPPVSALGAGPPLSPTVPFPTADMFEIRLPPAAPEAPARKASDFFHDISKLPAPGNIVPRAKDEVAAPAEDAPAVDIEEYARISVELAEPGARKAAVLGAHELDPISFRKVDRHYRRAMERESKRGARALRDRFDEAYVLTWEAKHVGRFDVAAYAKLCHAQQRGLLVGELEEQGLDAALGARLRRVWKKRVAMDPKLRAQVEEALKAGGEGAG